MKPQIRYARTTDGVDVAYTVVGSGPPLLVVRGMMAPDVDAEMTDASELRAPWLDLAKRHTVVFWDNRGSGLSGPAATYTLELALLDMHAVVRELADPPFDVLAMLTPCHVALAYAAHDTNAIKALVLWNPSPSGYSMRTGWGGLPDIAGTHFREYADLAALRIFSWNRPERARRYADQMVERYTAESWTRLNESMEGIDATVLAPSVRSRTMVMIDVNAFNLRLITPERQQYSRRLAASMPNAQLSIIKEGDTRAYVALVESFLRADAIAAPGGALPQGTAVILFADIVDSTAMTETLGDAAFRERARQLDERLRAAIRAASGTPVEGKLLGDGVLAVFSSARQAIDAALHCASAGGEFGLQLHLGIHAGDVIREGDNVYGGAVNIASRISGLSAPDEVLVSATVRDLARTSAGVTFEDRGEHALKGVGEAVRLFAIRPLEVGPEAP